MQNLKQKTFLRETKGSDMNIEPKKKSVLKISVKKKTEIEPKAVMTDKMKQDVAEEFSKRKSKEIAKKFFLNIKNK